MEGLNLKWVSDVIKDDYKKWNKGDIITLDCQTGTGKSYFIENVLIPYAYERKEKVLILCNRTALRDKVKKGLCKVFDKEIPENLDDMYTIENTTVLTYQFLGEKMNNSKEVNINHYRYVICDECHFMFTDSTFNNRCSYVYNLLMKNLLHNKYCTKIFMSATMGFVKDYITKTSDKLFYDVKNYTTGRDYSYVTLNTFKKPTDILEYIKASNEKWLIFESSKSRGKKMKEELEKYNSCEFITADDKENIEFQNIINKESFDCDVLIATSVLDNGVNISDNKINNIVISAWDETTFIQELGRLRIDIRNPRNINLFIPFRSKKAFILKSRPYRKTENDCIEYRNDIKSFKSKYNNNYDKLDTSVFNLDKKTNKWSINIMGYVKYSRDLSLFNKVIKDFGDGNNKNEYAFINKQKEWIGECKMGIELRKVKKYDEVLETDIKVRKYLEEHIGVRLFKEDRKELINILGLKDSRGRLQKQKDTLDAYLFNNYNLHILSKQIKINNKRETVWLLSTIK